MKHFPARRTATEDQSRSKSVRVAAFLVVAVCTAGFLFNGTRTALAQRGMEAPKEQDGRYDTLLMPMQASPLDRSLAELVAAGWRVVGVTVSGRIFQYHLVGEGFLAVCFVNTAGSAPGSECVRLAPVPR